jgi:hypothetical protein
MSSEPLVAALGEVTGNQQTGFTCKTTQCHSMRLKDVKLL